MADWLQVNTSTGDIYSKLRTPADASGLPTETGGSWIQVETSEYELAANGERVSWNNGASVGSRVEENPYPRLRFTGGNVTGKPWQFALIEGQANPPQVTITAVDRDGEVMSLPGNVTRRIKVGGSVDKWRDITLNNGTVSYNIPVASVMYIEIGAQRLVLNPSGAEVDGFLVENPLLIVVASASSETDIA